MIIYDIMGCKGSSSRSLRPGVETICQCCDHARAPATGARGTTQAEQFIVRSRFAAVHHPSRALLRLADSETLGILTLQCNCQPEIPFTLPSPTLASRRVDLR